ncbi:predicted protein [Histoplasma capsulatum G186AR]|uniref:Uncharacterized protein n=1 Tax=Ajellomyces capsulatus (strain G186AR / H82 / ATCC MYA-2454 / RMSCC 2432) TaxID=447093 RepID=C0NXU8_AJECG|nr:uncharacterized protein HCBG_07742 [Histoplasma capsulatum G186AR]EEH03616.1 predicted protein [Histoplasma capsulatum G186AR]
MAGELCHEGNVSKTPFTSYRGCRHSEILSVALDPISSGSGEVLTHSAKAGENQIKVQVVWEALGLKCMYVHAKINTIKLASRYLEPMETEQKFGGVLAMHGRNAMILFQASKAITKLSLRIEEAKKHEKDYFQGYLFSTW